MTTMYKCFECGNLFEEGEQMHVRGECGGQECVCPACGGGYDESYACEGCGHYFFADELYKGRCVDCVIATMGVDHMTEYLEARNLEADFYLGKFYNSEVKAASKDLIALARGGFLQKVAIQRLSHKQDGALKELKEFILDDDVGLLDYADWLGGE